VNRKEWYPTEHTVICSEHFIHGQKSNNQFAPNYIPTIFKPIDRLMKRKIEAQVADFHRRTASRKRRLEQTEKSAEQMKRAKKRKVQELAESRKSQEEAGKAEEQRLKEMKSRKGWRKRERGVKKMKERGC